MLPAASDATTWIGLAACGLVTGIINVVAGGGSFLTLPVLIWLGLPPTVANGTNRIGILGQNLGGVAGFRGGDAAVGRLALRAAGPATLGALAGAALALRIGDAPLRRVLAILMVVVTLWTLLDPLSRFERARRPGRLALGAVFFGVGAYAGFVQAGSGFLILAATSLAGLDLVRGNNVKVLCMLAFTVLTLPVFALGGLVHWPMGLALGAGSLVGGAIGARLSVARGQAFVRAVVSVAIVVFAVALWLE